MSKADFPKISIVTPSFNQAEFLEQTITSVLSQNYPNLEYIIIDGGSTDGSVEIIKKYADKLTYWVSEPDRGHGDALNKGFKRSTGEIMAWINSDDFYFPWTFAIVSEIFRDSSQISWLTSSTKLMANRQGVIGQRHNFISFGRKAFKQGVYLPDNGNCIPQESTFWQRSLWEEAGGYTEENRAIVPDFELWARFWQSAELCTVSAPLGAIRMYKEQTTSKNFAFCCAEARKIWKKQGGTFTPYLGGFLRQQFLRIPLIKSAIQNTREVAYDYKTNNWCLCSQSLWRNIGRKLGVRLVRIAQFITKS